MLITRVDPRKPYLSQATKRLGRTPCGQESSCAPELNYNSHGHLEAINELAKLIAFRIIVEKYLASAGAFSVRSDQSLTVDKILQNGLRLV